MPRWLKRLGERIGGRLRRAAQTRTDADTEDRLLVSRMRGTVRAYRTAAAMMTAAQLLLWVYAGYDRAAQGLWQAALLLIPGGVAVWAVSRRCWGMDPSRRPGGPGRGAGWGGSARDASRPGYRAGGARRPWELLLLLPCLLLDGLVLMHTLLSLLHQLMPSYPAGILRVVIPALLILGTLSGKRNGVAYGSHLWRWLLTGLLVWICLQGIRSGGTERLFPLLGRGVPVTLGTALAGLGALWAVPLLFLLPEGQPVPVRSGKGKPSSALPFVLLPLGLCALASLMLCCMAPWRPEAAIPAGLRLLLPARIAGGMILSGLNALFWLALLMLALAITLMSGQKMGLWLFPGLKPALPPLVIGLLAAGSLWLWPEGLPRAVTGLLPWRILLWAAAAVWAGGRRWREGHRAAKG